MSKKVSARLVFREYLESLLVAGVLALVLRLFVISPYKIPTTSMAPTLQAGDFVMAYKLSYGLSVPFQPTRRWAPRMPRRGDVVVFRYPGNPAISYVKRVVGLPGDRVEIIGKRLSVNGQAAEYDEVEIPTGDLPAAEDYQEMRETLGGSTRLVMSHKEELGSDFGPVVVPPGHVFVLGDNRDSSDDSRYWGAVPVTHLDGRIVVVWMSMDWGRRWFSERFPSIRWERVFQTVR